MRFRCVSAPRSSGRTGSSTPRTLSEPHRFCIGTILRTPGDRWIYTDPRRLFTAAWLLSAIGQFARVVYLVAQRVDHRAKHQRQAEDVEPEQGDEDESQGGAEAGEARHAGEVDGEKPV